MSNPNLKAGPGRPKGTKNKLSRSVKERIMQVWDALEREEKGLEDEAKKDPQWFYQNFVKGMVPKDIVVQGDEDNPLRQKVMVEFVNPGEQ